MEILHLLPAALETLFSVYWLNACHFCTVDVNNKKKKELHRSHAETKACSHSRECEICGSQKKKIQSSIFCCWINIRLVMTSLLNCYWAQGQTTPHRCFCTNFCQCFLLFLVIDWLDFLDNGTWHLLWLKFVGKCIWALQWKVKCSYYWIRRNTVNYELNRLHALKGEQYWGTQRFMTIFVRKVFKRVGVLRYICLLISRQNW